MPPWHAASAALPTPIDLTAMLEHQWVIVHLQEAITMLTERV